MKIAFSFCHLTLLCASGVFASERPAKPNIILILTDDQGYGDVGRHGHPLLKTPHMDQLYDESVRFDNFYVSPSCSPTRAALLTGMHEFRNGVTHTREPREHLYREAVLLPELLRTAGYATGFIGKWHLSNAPGYAPRDRGFDWCSTNAGGPHEHFDPVCFRNRQRTKRQGYREDVFMDEAMTFIDECSGRPFFCYLATYSPHDPLDAPDEFVAPFRNQVDEKRAKYLGMVANLDFNLGRLLAFLRERRLEENTIVIFMNDNGQTWGLDVYNAGMRGCKATIWEGGSRAMSFWRWPGQWKSHRVENLTAHLDVLPTLCELAGVEVSDKLSAELEGFSLMPLLNASEPVRWHDDRMLFHHVARWPGGLAAAHKYATCGVRQQHFLLLRSRPCSDPRCPTAVLGSPCAMLRRVEKGRRVAIYTDNRAEFHWGASPADRWVLFDVKRDPTCQKDLALDQPQRVASMTKAYDAWWDDVYPIMIERGGDTELNSLRTGSVRPSRQTPAGNNSPGAAEQRAAQFRKMDTNGNTQISKKEHVAFYDAVFARLDADQGGKLDVTEFTNAAAIKFGDKDKDGKLTRDHYQAVFAKQFSNLDRNNDGTISAEEWKSIRVTK